MSEKLETAAGAWGQEYGNLTLRERNDFARLVNRLLGRTFLIKAKEETRRDFYFLERREALFREYFGFAGWELRLDRALGVAQAVPPDGASRVSLDLTESLMLLVLRLIYEEKRKELSLTADVVTTVQEVQEKYLTLRLRAKPLDRKSLKQSLALFMRFDLVDSLEQDLTDPDTRLRLYPSLLFAIRADSLAALHARLASYRKDSGITESTDEDGGESADGSKEVPPGAEEAVQ